MEYNDYIKMGVFGVLSLIFGIISRLCYRAKFSQHTKGQIVSSRCETNYHYDYKTYDMYATVNYEVDGILYQENFELIGSNKYYHFLSQGNFVTLVYPPQDPSNVQIKRLFVHKGKRLIRWGLLALAGSVLMMISYHNG